MKVSVARNFSWMSCMSQCALCPTWSLTLGQPTLTVCLWTSPQTVPVHMPLGLQAGRHRNAWTLWTQTGLTAEPQLFGQSHQPNIRMQAEAHTLFSSSSLYLQHQYNVVVVFPVIFISSPSIWFSNKRSLKPVQINDGPESSSYWTVCDSVTLWTSCLTQTILLTTSGRFLPMSGPCLSPGPPWQRLSKSVLRPKKKNQ